MYWGKREAKFPTDGRIFPTDEIISQQMKGLNR
jgi:hypothetical protein